MGNPSLTSVVSQILKFAWTSSESITVCINSSQKIRDKWQFWNFFGIHNIFLKGSFFQQKKPMLQFQWKFIIKESGTNDSYKKIEFKNLMRKLNENEINSVTVQKKTIRIKHIKLVYIECSSMKSNWLTKTFLVRSNRNHISVVLLRLQTECFRQNELSKICA